MYKQLRLAAIIPAGGSGTRMGSDKKKQFLTFQGREILYWTLKHILDCGLLDCLVVVVPEVDYVEMEIKLCDWAKTLNTDVPMKVVIGGSSRQASVYCGLQAIEDSYDVILVHDGVRPFLPSSSIPTYLDRLMENDQLSGVIAGLEVTDTLKCVDHDHVIIATVDRSNKWHVQTPQIFKANALMHAHEQARQDQVDATDDAALLERLGDKLMMVYGTSENIKITRPVDLIVAEMIFKTYGGRSDI